MHTQQRKSDGSSPPTGAVPLAGSPVPATQVLAGDGLFRQAQGGCHESLNALMERHEGLVRAVVRRQVLGDLPYGEALQAGRAGLWRAILRFDPERGYAFSTYA